MYLFNAFTFAIWPDSTFIAPEAEYTPPVIYSRENREQNAYTEVYAYRSNLAIQVRCIRPAGAAAAWSSTFDAGCQSIVSAVEK